MVLLIKKMAFGLIIILATLVLYMDGERGRLIDWFDAQNTWAQWLYGVLLAVFISVCIAVVLVPVALDWIYYFETNF